MDTIFIRGMVISGRHGVGAKERARPQRFGVDVEVTQEPTDWKDSIRNTYDYMHARRIAHTYVEEHTFKLIETLAENIAREVLTHRLVQSVTVTIRKLDIFAEGEGGVTLTRSRG